MSCSACGPEGDSREDAIARWNNRAGEVTKALLSLKEVAELFPGKSPDWVRRSLIQTGMVTHVRVGRSLFVHRDSVEHLMSKKTPVRRWL